MRKILAVAALALLAISAQATGLFDIVTKGSVDRSVTVDIIDSTDGTPETGVVFNTSGIDLWYRREGAALVSITEATLASLTTAHSDGGFLHVANGTYRLDLPDAAFATGANYVDFGGTVTGMIVIGGRVRLVDYSLEDAVRGTTGTALPNAAAGASGGVLISGSNSGTTTLAALTVSGATTLTGNVSMAAGLNITQSTSNTAALVVTGNGTGNGATFTSGSGATGNGISAVAASTNGNGLNLAGTGTGSGALATGGATGHGINGVGGSTSGNGLRAAGTAGNSAAANLVGQGSAAGLLSTGGATGHGISAVGGATSGSGLSTVASTSGSGIVATGVGTTQPGIAATGGATSSAGISATGGGTGSGILATSGSGATGNGITATAASTNGNGAALTGTGTGTGLSAAITGSVTGNLSGSVGSVTGNVGGNVTGSVGTIASAGITEASFATTSGSFAPLGLTRQATAQGASSTTVTLDASAPFGDNTNIGSTLWVKGSTNGNYWQACSVSAYVASTKIATVTCPSGFVTPTGTISYQLFGVAAGSGGSGLDAAGVRAAVGLASANLDTQLSGIQSDTDNLQTRVPISLVSGRIDASVGAYQTGLTPLQPTTAGRTLDVSATGEAGVDWANVGSPTTSVNLSGTTISTSQAVASVSGAVGSVTGNVGGNVTGSVGSVATGGITAASIATDAIGAAELASDAGTELATANWANGTRTLSAGTNIVLAKGTGITGFNDLSSAQVNTEVDTALADIYLDRLFAADYDPASKPGVSTALLNELVESDAGVSRFTANALEQGPAGGGGSTNITQIEGSDATDVIDGRIAAAGLATSSALSAHDAKIGTPTNLGSGANLAANLADIESQTDDIGVAGAGLTAADDAVMTRLGTPASASVSADVAALKSDSAAILVDTAEIGVAGAGLTAVDDAVLAAIAGLNNLSAAQVRDSISEDQGGGVARGCIEAVLLAFAAGDISTTGQTTTWRDPSNGEVRITSTVTSNGNRTASISCPTY